MSFRVVASANGVISVLTGIMALAAPAVLAALYTTVPTERETAIVQLLGASYIAIGLVSWLLRDAADEYARRGVAISALVAWALSLVVTLISLRMATGPAVWGNVALQVAFSLAWAYVLTVSRNETRTVRA